MDGILLVDKPAGPTSHEVVARVRREWGISKAGHAGTLDPQATGLLVLGLGSATRWLDWLPKDKRYVATLRLGLETSTQDIWGRELRKGDASGLDRETVFGVLRQLAKIREQVPPVVSALKHRGRPLYEWERRGQPIQPKARPVEIYEIRPLAYDAERAEATFEVHCGPGTYVRSLCAQAGRELGCGGALAALRRTQVGTFRVEEAVPLSDLAGAAQRILPASRALAHLRERRLSAVEAAAVRCGRDLEMEGDGGGQEGWRLTAADGSLLALGRPRRVGERWRLHPARVFAAP